VLLFLAVVIFLLFMGLGFLSHMLWLGVIASFVLLIGHMVRHGLTGRTPTSRFNVRLVRAFSGFLDDVLESRAREAERSGRVEPMPELGPAGDEVTEAEIVEDGRPQEPTRTAAANVRRTEVRASVAERAAHWRAMTPAKLEKAEEMAADGASRAEIARKLGVSRSTVSRHLAGKVS
jgi:DNA-binding transcriptional ArsR family regulator